MTYKHNKEWRRENPEKWLAEKAKYYARTAGPENNRNWMQRWTLREDKVILKREDLDRELHGLLGRSVRAIQVRRSRLRKEILI